MGVRNWATHLPSRWHWLSLLSSPSSYLLLLSVLGVVLAKYLVLARLESMDAGIGSWLVLISSDIALHFALIVLFSFGEARSPKLLVVTLPLALSVSAFAIINALYLNATGEQLTVEAFRYGVEKHQEVLGILGEEGLISIARIMGVFVVFSVPVVADEFLKRRKKLMGKRERGHIRVRTALFIATPAFVLAMMSPNSSSLLVQALGGNAMLQSCVDWAYADEEVLPGEGDPERWFAGYRSPRLLSPDAVEGVSRATAPLNLVVVVLESVRWDYTSLAPAATAANTPNLLALARRGTLVTQARAIMPHTTKSLFSILCGRLPLMQRTNLEAIGNAPIQCLPSLLAEAGYHTVFMQSAIGAFEDRPRLVARAGFREFKAWEDIKGEPLGYLASDDESLVPALDQWLEEQKQGAFMVTLLTSATHHPYRLSGKIKERIRSDGAPSESNSERYARLIEGQDHMLGAVEALLRKRELLDSTLIVVVGDHGEGFGEKGIKQHDNNFYEQGLHVPLVLAGPGVPIAKVTRNASLVDIVPTLLPLLGLPLDERTAQVLPGSSFFDSEVPNKKHFFACYFDGHCYGYVQGNKKVVVAKNRRKSWYFDLSNDPEEHESKELTNEMRASLPELFRLVDAHRTNAKRDSQPPQVNFGQWQCEVQGRCRHPDSPPGLFFEKPGD